MVKKERSIRKIRKAPYKRKVKKPDFGYYSFDISYWLDDPVDQKAFDEFFEEFEGKLKWYAADTGPFGSTERKTRNNGYLLDDPIVLLSVIKKAKAHDKFFIDFVSKKDEGRIWSRGKKPDEKMELTDIEEEIRSILDGEKD